MTTRLSKAMREDIAVTAIRDRFTDEVMDLVKRRAALAVAVYNIGYSAKERALIASLPDGWLEEEAYVAASFVGQSEYVYFDGRAYLGYAPARKHGASPDYRTLFYGVSLEGEHYARVPYSSNRIDVANGPVNEERSSINSAQKNLIELVNGTLATTLAALSNFTTFEKLIDAWPEIEPTARKCLKVSTPAQLPAVNARRLNEVLGLPIEEEVQ